MTDKLQLAELLDSNGTSGRKRTFEESISTTNAATKRTIRGSDTEQPPSYRQSLASYRKHFTPILMMDTIKIEPSANRIIHDSARRKLDYNDQPIQTGRSPNENVSDNLQKKILRLTTDVKSLKRTILMDEVKEYSKPANLEYELRKKRFFETFQRKPQHSQSYSQLARKFRLNY